MSSKEDSMELDNRIARAKNELEEMIDLNPQVIVLVNGSGQIIRANKATLDFLKLDSFDEILAKDFSEVITPKDPNATAKLLAEGDGYTSVTVDTDIAGVGERRLQLSLVNSGSKSDQAVVLINDVSDETKRALDIERRHKKEAVQALTGALMHNINQPLTVIMMRAQMMKVDIQRGQVDPSEVRRVFDDIMKLAMNAADRLQGFEDPQDYVTEPYVDGVEIFSVEGSGTPISQLKLTCSATLDVLLGALDTRIPGTVHHARQSGELAYAIAKAAGLDERSCEVARAGGYLHDIGKLCVPDSVALKEGIFTPEEKLIMNRHAEVGYRIVKSMIFMQDEAEAVGRHHERWDGTGYPDGIAGDDIPISARIVACADAFDVMLSGRPYCGPLTLEETIQELKKGSGKQFDPGLVDVLVTNAVKFASLVSRDCTP